MNIQEITSQLEQRGVVWQSLTFASIGTVTLIVLTVYSGSQHWAVEAYRLLVLHLHWAYIPIIVLTVDRIREMFKTTTQIRQEAREKALAKATQKAVAARDKHFRAVLRKRRIELSPEDEIEFFGTNGHDGRRFFSWLPWSRD